MHLFEAYILGVFLKYYVYFFPFISYIFLCLFSIPYQKSNVPDRLLPKIDKKQDQNLKLMAFSFTVFAFMATVSHNYDKIDIRTSAILSFVGLTFFSSSYFIFHIRRRRIYLTISHAFMSNGIWVVLISFYYLLKSIELTRVFSYFVVIPGLLFLFVLFIDIKNHYLQFRRM